MFPRAVNLPFLWKRDCWMWSGANGESKTRNHLKMKVTKPNKITKKVLTRIMFHHTINRKCRVTIQFFIVSISAL